MLKASVKEINFQKKKKAVISFPPKPKWKEVEAKRCEKKEKQ